MEATESESKGASLFFRDLPRALVNRYKSLCAGEGKTMKQDVLEIIKKRIGMMDDAGVEVPKKKKKKKKKRIEA